MKLFDFGNSRYKWVDIDDISTISVMEYDESNPVGVIVSGLAGHAADTDLYAISVRPKSFNDEIACRYKLLTGRRIHFLKYQSDLLVINYSDTGAFGIDRFAAMLGAQAKGLYPSIIVDAGTAVTIDVLDRNQRHLGGCILPGKDLMMQAMTNKSPALQYDHERWSNGGTSALLGGSTSQCMASGVANSIAGAIFSTHTSLGREYSIHVTGGDAQWVIDNLDLLNVAGAIQSSLLFEGMKKMIRGQY